MSEELKLDFGVSVLMYTFAAMFAALVAWVLISVVLSLRHRDQIQLWKRFVASVGTKSDPEGVAPDYLAYSYVLVEGRVLFFFGTKLSIHGIVVEKVAWHTRLIYPRLFLRWDQISTVSERKHMGWRADDMLAVVDISAPHPQRIVIPWRSGGRTHVPMEVRYVPLAELSAQNK
ncbi:MAG: hypothetical protein JNM50_03450 [Chromatiales bacterium]|nr:hypothetical protein [Chromatiales bacterium]